MKIDKTPIHWESIAGINLPRARFWLIDRRTRLTLTPRLCVLWEGGGYKPPRLGPIVLIGDTIFVCTAAVNWEKQNPKFRDTAFTLILSSSPSPPHPPSSNHMSVIFSPLPPSHTLPLSHTRVNLIFRFPSFSFLRFARKPALIEFHFFNSILSLSGAPGFQFRFCSKFDYLRVCTCSASGLDSSVTSWLYLRYCINSALTCRETFVSDLIGIDSEYYFTSECFMFRFRLLTKIYV